MIRLFALALAILMSLVPIARSDDTLTARFIPHAAGSKATIDHGAWNAILAAHVVAGTDGINRLAYRRLQGEPAAAIKRYIKAMETAPVASLDQPEQQAFWINLYNAVTVDTVLDRYPVKSIYDVNLKNTKGELQDGPWKTKLVTVDGVPLSLDEIENAIVRPIFKDARAHYALNCLSIGCPNLHPAAFTGANLETTFEALARAFVNHPRAISFAADGKVTASSIYDWFVIDFGGFAGVVAHLQRYATPTLASKLAGLKSVNVYAYDWALADASQ